MQEKFIVHFHLRKYFFKRLILAVILRIAQAITVSEILKCQILDLEKIGKCRQLLQWYHSLTNIKS